MAKYQVTNNKLSPEQKNVKIVTAENPLSAVVLHADWKLDDCDVEPIRSPKK